MNEKGEKLYINQNGEETTKAETDGNANKAKLASGWASLQTGLNVGFGSDEDSQSSQTVSGINTKNITIRDEQGSLTERAKPQNKLKRKSKLILRQIQQNAVQGNWKINLIRRKYSKKFKRK